MAGIREVLTGPLYIAKAMLTTFKHNTRPIVTISYPERQKPVPPRERGRHILHRYADGLEKCVGCELCAIACPVGCIVVEAAENTPEHRVSPGERYAKRYEINLLRCIYCGMCEEACPVEAIELTGLYDLTGLTREQMIFDKAKLLSVFDATKDAEPMRYEAAPPGPAPDTKMLPSPLD
jgi:NADH-quinone oxidoreductase subunit I